MITVFMKIAMIFLMSGVGYVACKKGILPLEAKEYFVSLLMKITCPCMIFSSLATQELNAKTFRIMKEILLGSVIFFALAILLSFVIVKFLHYNKKEDEGVLMVLMTALNTGFMGFPVTKAIFGDMFFFLMVLENTVLNIYLYIISLFQMNYGHHQKADGSRIKSIMNLNTIATIVGIVVLILAIPIPEFAMDFFVTMGNATIPLSMIILGVQLCESEFTDIIKNKALLICCLCNVLLVPGLTFAIVNLTPLMTESKLILIFAAAFPCAVATVPIAMQEGRNAKLMAEGVALSTLMSVITLPIWAIFLMQQYIHI